MTLWTGSSMVEQLTLNQRVAGSSPALRKFRKTNSWVDTMGLWANYPIALAPGMSLNAYFTYSIVLSRGVPWQTALGVVFLSGLLFLILTLSKNARASRQRDSGLPQAWDRGGHRGCSSRSADYATRKSLWPIPLLSWGSANLPTHRVLLAAAGLTAIRIS